MPEYDLEARYLIQNDLRQLDNALIDELWKLFLNIARFWGNSEKSADMKNNFLIFISNRLQTDYNYLTDYVNAVAVVKELDGVYGAGKGYEKLLTGPFANVNPPQSRLARARQRVANEFIKLQLALGGFKRFGSDKNYPGYICGPNLPDNTPYRTYPK